MAANNEKNFEETPVLQEMKDLVYHNTNYTWDPYDTIPTAIMVFLGISKHLRTEKSLLSSGSVAVRVKDSKGNFLFAAVLRYIENTENEDMPGNWNLSYTTFEEDLEDVDIVRDHNHHGLVTAIDEVCRRVYNWGLISKDFIPDMIEFLIRAIFNTLDKNAPQEGQEPFTIKLDGIFVASIEVKNGEKIIAMIPGDTSKNYIKADVEIQK